MVGVSHTMLYLIGLGLGDASDVSVKGLEIIKRADRVYLEAYTSLLAVDKNELEHFYGRDIISADRELVEEYADEILKDANISDVAFLVVGDPLGATTHSDLIIRANERGIPYKVIHNASIMNAIGACGLQLYNYGETVSIPYWSDSWQPDSFIDKIEQNLCRGLHTLCLLDIKVKELSVDALMKGKREYEPPRFMTVEIAVHQLLKAIEKHKDRLKYLIPERRCIGVSRIGSPDEMIIVDTLINMCGWNLGRPLHSLVIIGETHPLEDTMLNIVHKNTAAIIS